MNNISVYFFTDSGDMTKHLTEMYLPFFLLNSNTSTFKLIKDDHWDVFNTSVPLLLYHIALLLGFTTVSSLGFNTLRYEFNI